MQRFYLRTLFLCLFSFIGTSIFAYDYYVDGIYYNLDIETNTAIVTNGDSKYEGEIVIPASIKNEGDIYTVTAIGESAFFDCSGLLSVTIPYCLSKVAYNAFQNCNSLNAVHITDLDAWCKIDFEGEGTIGGHLYLNGEEIKELIIPNTVTEINQYAFKGFIGLTSVTIPNSVKAIGYGAFAYCTNLTSVIIPNSVTSIGDCAFSDCYELASITIPNSVTSIGNFAFRGCSSLTSITIPNSVLSIGDGAFSGCNNLLSVTIPKEVVSIGSNAFGETSWYDNQADGLIYIENILYRYKGVMPMNTEIVIKEGTTEICGSAFSGYKGLSSVTIPTTVTNIGSSAFSGCNSLTSVTIPNSVTNIGSSAFSGCSGLTSITIPNSVTSIDGFTFSGCSSLISVTIPNNVTRIGMMAFSDCYSLAFVSLPNSIKEIAWRAFGGCFGLVDVYCYAFDIPQPTNTYSEFQNSSIGNATLHVPELSIDLYKSAKPWSDFGTIVALDDEDEEESDDVELAENVDTYYNGTEKTLTTLTYTRTFNNTQWQALYVPFSMSYDDWKDDFEVARVNAFYEYDTDNDGVVDKQVLEVLPVKEGNGDLRPNYPYLIKAKTTGEKTISLTDATLYVTEENGIECSTVETKYTFIGTYHKMNGLKSAGYYFMSGGGLKTAASDATNLGAFRWYLKTESKGSALLPKAEEIKIRVAGEEEEEDATGIANVETGIAAGKVYSLDGRMVSTGGTDGLKAGLYIVNGKKVFVK
ncbi:MAG: leucine-rich repeat domain-containing protein [Bacteroidaceae bacterium]|nr:leucine-rich repeat domain-containing protein [Bacteroidaceae bacterium]